MVQLVPLKESDTCTVAEKFLSMVVSQHRLPEYIMIDCDLHFSGHFWDDLMSLLHMTLTYRTASHPQTDGIAEVPNCTMEKL